MTNTPKEREEFEAHLIRRGRSTERARDGSYYELRTQADWLLWSEAWQLARSRPAATTEEQEEFIQAKKFCRDKAHNSPETLKILGRCTCANLMHVDDVRTLLSRLPPPSTTTEEHKDWCIGGEKGPCNCKGAAPVSAMQGEAVAWRYRHIFPSGRPSEIWVYTGDAKLARRFKKLGDFEVEPLYTHPPAVQAGDAFAPGMPTPWTQQLYEAVQRDFKRGQNCKDDEPVINVDRLLDLIAEISSAPTEPPKPEGVKCRNPACCLCGSLVSPPQPAPKERQ